MFPSMSVILLAFPVVMVRGYGFQYSADLVFPDGSSFWVFWYAWCDSLFWFLYSCMIFMVVTGLVFYLRF